MNQNVAICRLSTGVPGLDSVLGGGIPEFSFNLIGGSPGCGKTTLAHQIMFACARLELPAIYFTVLGEPPVKMLRYQQQFEFFKSEEVNRSIHFISLADECATGDLSRVLARIVAEFEARGPAYVFVDSFRSAIEQRADGSTGKMGLQEFVQKLAVLMTSWQATTFLIGEYSAVPESNPVFTVADGLIWLRQSSESNSMVRKLEVIKMRGQATLPGLHTFRINSGGLSVIAPAHAAVEAEVPDPGKDNVLSIGIPALDEMLGGGLPRGYSLLVAGPSGSGKSITASAFLIEGARTGETGVIAAFEQRPNRSRGDVLAKLIAADKVGVVQNIGSELSVDEMANLLLDEIRRLKASRVVIDSLSGFELALAPTFQKEFRQSLARLVDALARTGVTVLMTSELEDRYTDLRFSPYGTAFLTDAIIVQRYIEVDSRLRRIVAVVKMRARSHSDELRLFHIDDTGICIGPKVADYEGLLGGRPRLSDARGVADPRALGD
jgi:circadian clock protein KaiC